MVTVRICACLVFKDAQELMAKEIEIAKDAIFEVILVKELQSFVLVVCASRFAEGHKGKRLVVSRRGTAQVIGDFLGLGSRFSKDRFSRKTATSISSHTLPNSPAVFDEAVNLNFKLWLFQLWEWADAVVLVFSVDNEASFETIHNYYAQMGRFRAAADLPLILVGTQGTVVGEVF